MIPEGSIKVRTNVVRMLIPDVDKISGLTDSEWGGTDVKNTDHGFLVHIWTVSVNDDGQVRLYRGQEFHSILWVQEGIADIALTFDQTMNPMLAWRTVDNDLFLRSFDAFTQSFIVTPFGKGKCPRLSLDDKRPIAIGISDIIFAYIQDNELCYRQQREAFLVKHVIVSDLHPSQRLDRIGMGGFQFQFELSSYEEDV